MITVLILLVFSMHIKSTKLLEDSTPNAKFNADEKLRLGSTGLDWDDSAQIEKAIATNKDNKDKKRLPMKEIGNWRGKSNIKNKQPKKKLAQKFSKRQIKTPTMTKILMET